MTDKEKLFCRYFLKLRNSREAASATGYKLPKSAATRLMARSDIQREIERLESKNQTSFSEVVSGLRRLAFGSSADAVKLIFCESLTNEEIEKLDLFNVSDIKRPKGGGLEIKFFDRQKALEKLLEISESGSSETSISFLTALENGANALGGDTSGYEEANTV